MNIEAIRVEFLDGTTAELLPGDLSKRAHIMKTTTPLIDGGLPSPVHHVQVCDCHAWEMGDVAVEHGFTEIDGGTLVIREVPDPGLGW